MSFHDEVPAAQPGAVNLDTTDPFLRLFYSRIPRDVAATFTEAQLDAVRRAFGARSPGAHAVDLRFSLPLIVRRYYVVFLAGRERRSSGRLELERRLRPLWTAANAFVVVLFLLLLAGSAFSVLYAAKRSLGIDLVPGIDMLPDRQMERLLD